MFSLADLAAYLSENIDTSEGPVVFVDDGTPVETVAYLMDALDDDRAAVVILRELPTGTYTFTVAVYEGEAEDSIMESVCRRMENVDGLLLVDRETSALSYGSNPGTLN